MDAFENADESFADVPPGFESENFDKEVVKGDEFLSRLDGADTETVVANCQKFLLGALLDDKSTGHCEYEVGSGPVRADVVIDSDLHGNAVYTLGYDHPETIRLARM